MGKKKIYCNREELLAACALDFLDFHTFSISEELCMGWEFPNENKLIVVFGMDYSNQ